MWARYAVQLKRTPGEVPLVDQELCGCGHNDTLCTRRLHLELALPVGGTADGASDHISVMRPKPTTKAADRAGVRPHRLRVSRYKEVSIDETRCGQTSITADLGNGQESRDSSDSSARRKRHALSLHFPTHRCAKRLRAVVGTYPEDLWLTCCAAGTAGTYHGHVCLHHNGSEPG
jgi:hypothetical protein